MMCKDLVYAVGVAANVYVLAVDFNWLAVLFLVVIVGTFIADLVWP